MTRLFRLAACSLAVTLLASACVGIDPVSPTAPATSLVKVGGDTLTTTATTSSATGGDGCTLSDSTATGSDSTATSSDSTNANCLGDTLPWARSGDSLPWARQ
jgi:hypothetical protein